MHKIVLGVSRVSDTKGRHCLGGSWESCVRECQGSPLRWRAVGLVGVQWVKAMAR